MSDESLSEWLSRPFRVGWTLWAGVFWPLAGRIAPLAVVLGLVGWIVTLGLNPETDDVAPEERPFVLLFSLVLLGMAFGVALVGVLLSGCHTDLVRGSPYRWALRRFVPWIGTWALMITITTIGLWFFLVPGIYLALRLFWADEFALIDGRNPIASLKASWELTRSGVGAMLVFQLLVGLVACVVATAVLGIQGSLLAVVEFLGWVGLMPFVGGLAFVYFGLLAYGAVHAVEIAMFYGRFGEKGPGSQEPGRGPASSRSSITGDPPTEISALGRRQADEKAEPRCCHIGCGVAVTGSSR